MLVMNKLLQRVAAHRAEDGVLNLDCGAAGTVARFLTALLSICNGQFILRGTERMQQRPMKPLIDALRQLGALIESETPDDSLPLVITGRKLDGGQVDVEATISSQFVSALMLIAPAMKRGISIRMKGKLISEPYVQMTARLMQDAGIGVDLNEHFIKISAGLYKSIPVQGFADWSATAPWYELVALNPALKIYFKNLTTNGLQGDEKITNLYRCFGVVTVSSDTGLTIFNTGQVGMLPSTIDFSDYPDLAPCYLATLAGLNISQRITGLNTLRIKETDRLKAMCKGITELGGSFKIVDDDSVEISRHRGLHHGSVDFYDDHRIAFAFAPLVVLTQPLLIDDPLVVGKSYPGFFYHLQQVGITLG